MVELTDLGHVVYTALAEDGSALKKRGRHSEHLPAGRAVLINVGDRLVVGRGTVLELCAERSGRESKAYRLSEAQRVG